ncbi:gamma-glutamylcyclotransferase family protein [Mangrovimonas aestuarii]|uniref:gamma-glutamylcyclotransferase family protein n=1 Tax=Mangrovimonas aestuarii TaxID=3018443 RepID=UPI002378BDDD|nr:gamma-glutamylcyclotransferase family protein [Mangrovimonas aestuarii]
MNVFFYGLFMDVDTLAKKGINPSNPRKGYLKDYTLKIGNKASLIKCDNGRAYGIMMEMDNEEVIKLYSEKSVSNYKPEIVEIITDSNEHIMATCYILSADLLTGTNQLYAKLLHELAKKLNFPNEYLDQITKHY